MAKVTTQVDREMELVGRCRYNAEVIADKLFAILKPGNELASESYDCELNQKLAELNSVLGSLVDRVDLATDNRVKCEAEDDTEGD